MDHVGKIYLWRSRGGIDWIIYVVLSRWSGSNDELFQALVLDSSTSAIYEPGDTAWWTIWTIVNSEPLR